MQEAKTGMYPARKERCATKGCILHRCTVSMRRGKSSECAVPEARIVAGEGGGDVGARAIAGDAREAEADAREATADERDASADVRELVADAWCGSRSA